MVLQLMNILDIKFWMHLIFFAESKKYMELWLSSLQNSGAWNTFGDDVEGQMLITPKFSILLPGSVK